MGKNPAFQFYPNDWRSDMELQSCSLEARGLWIELLCLMHWGTPYGYLTLNSGVKSGNKLEDNLGDNPSDKLVAKWLGIHPVKYRKLLGELLSHNVAKKDDQGRIYCKRMVEDQRLREIRREAGLKGGNPILKNLIKQKVNQDLNQHGYPACTTPSSSSSPSKKDIDGSEPKDSKPEPVYIKRKDGKLVPLADYLRQAE